MVVQDEASHTFQHTWKDIFLASWKKYPSPSRPEILSIDFLKRELDTTTGILHTTRLVTIKSSAPTWLSKLCGLPTKWYFIEKGKIDPKNQKMVLKSRNVSLNQIAIMKETCIYTPHPEIPHWTLFRQRGLVTAFPLGVSRKIEELCVQTYKQNSGKGKELMEQAIARIKKEAEEGLVFVESVSLRIKKEADESLARIKKEADESLARIKKEADDGLVFVENVASTIKEQSVLV